MGPVGTAKSNPLNMVGQVSLHNFEAVTVLNKLCTIQLFAIKRTNITAATIPKASSHLQQHSITLSSASGIQ